MEYRARITLSGDTLGMHARPCAAMAEAIRGADASVVLRCDGKSERIDTSGPMMSLMAAAAMLGLTAGAMFEIICEGPDAQAALDKVRLVITTEEHFAGSTFEMLDGSGTVAEPVAAPPAPVVGAKVTLEDAIRAGGIHYDLPGRDKPSALAAMVAAISLPEGTDREAVLRAILSREALQSTGIGGGVAIPHYRAAACPSPVAAIGFLATPVDFGADDHMPVDVIIPFITSRQEDHLRLLGALARRLSKDRSFLRRCPYPAREEIFEWVKG